MLLDALRRFVAVILGDDVLPGAATAPDARAPGGDRAPVAVRERPTLEAVTARSPAIRQELAERSRSSGILIGSFAAVILPAWSLVDRMLEPELTGLLLLIRLVSAVPMLAAVWILWAAPSRWRRPEALTYLVLGLVQVDVAWMIPRVDNIEYYLMGFTLGIYASGCLMVSRPRWTVGLVAVSWAALAFFVVTAPTAMDAGDLAGTAAFLATASVIAVVAHLRRHLLSMRELTTRVHLEREQQRTGVLLAQLERLSHEDPLTGLANRRRWDAELVGVCTSARERGATVGVVLLDIDHFKTINDHHGHPGGDEALRQVARLLSDRVRGGDLVARLGGDEFAVLLPDADLDRAIELAERLRAEAARLVPAGFGPDELSLSLGVAAAGGESAYPLELMSRADEQLYRAKITRNAVGAPLRDTVVPS